MFVLKMYVVPVIIGDNQSAKQYFFVGYKYIHVPILILLAKVYTCLAMFLVAYCIV